MVSFSISPDTEVASVAIKVKDLDRVISFYQHVVGFELISEENDMAIMGIRSQNKKLLALIATPDGIEGTNNHTGLYHTSYVFPTREDLAQFIKHLMIMNYPIEGQSDHGYCESIYINDPENNLLEFSWDKPESEWPLSEGKIDGVTKELDIQASLNCVEGEYSRVPKSTKLGHVHLSVSNLEESYEFYINQLGFKVSDDDFSSTHLLTASNYHHHVALNEWKPSRITSMAKESDLGVDHITFELPSMDELQRLKENLELASYEFYYNKGKKIIGLSDPSGIELWFLVPKTKKTM